MASLAQEKRDYVHPYVLKRNKATRWLAANLAPTRRDHIKAGKKDCGAAKRQSIAVGKGNKITYWLKRINDVRSLVA
jgi:hypothetical protein